MQLSAKSVGLFEAFYNSVKPITLINGNFEIAKPGKIPRFVLIIVHRILQMVVINEYFPEF